MPIVERPEKRYDLISGADELMIIDKLDDNRVIKKAPLTGSLLRAYDEMGDCMIRMNDAYVVYKKEIDAYLKA